MNAAPPTTSRSKTANMTPAARTFDTRRFNRAYDDVILGNHFFEASDYYRWQRARYRRTLQYLVRLDLPQGARVLEIGGGQMLLLCHRLFGDHGTLVDVSDEFADAVTRFGLGFTACDLLHDDLEETADYDLVVMCEVVEHLPIPPHIVLRKISRWIRPGGSILLTTPNLYRLRNVVRLALGMRLFCHFFYPDRGKSLGHPLEYSVDHISWQLEQAGYHLQFAELAQLSNVGSTLATKLARWCMAPLLVRRQWRDSIVAAGRRSDADDAIDVT